ncbi:MAG: hypothetical protein KAI25_04705, partial [Hyphomicrobiaceae bacterium]|nr:hypothetical protein [Hyphomicrobiaceae bacterium]
SQLHRSPGIDFLATLHEGDRRLHGCRIIPERGSWIEVNVTKKDTLAVKIDQSAKLSATTFLRAMSEDYGTTEQIIRTFYDTKVVSIGKITAETFVVGAVVDPETGEEMIKAGTQVGENLVALQASSLKKLEVVFGKLIDPLILNAINDDRNIEDHDTVLLKIYSRLRPGNPPQQEKAKTLFAEKFFDQNRYRLGRVGRFRLNRKFEEEISEKEQTLRPGDFVNALTYIMKLRAGEGVVDDIDHLGNRRLRTIDELASDEIRKGLLKLRRTVQERMSLKDAAELTPRSLINSKSVSSSIDFFFGRGELSQVVDQTNPLSQLTHERRLSALGPGGLNRKRAGFEVRDVHISHYGRICPIETPEGTNIGLIASLSIYAAVDEYGFLITPYRQVARRKVNGKQAYLRADQEMRTILAPCDVVVEGGNLIGDQVLARVEGDLSVVDTGEIGYVDISPKQIVGVSAAL